MRDFVCLGGGVGGGGLRFGFVILFCCVFFLRGGGEIFLFYLDLCMGSDGI